MIKPDVAFLNHGSFGALPRCVFEAQNQWRLRIEAEPVEIIGRQAATLIDRAKADIGEAFGMDAGDFGMVTNATEGANAVLRSFPLESGDEIVTTNHVYHAVRRTMQYVAQQSGAAYREINIPLPVSSSDEIRDRVLQGIGPKTKLLVVDHVTSPTALVFPLAQIVSGCRAKGVQVLADGAHAPGMLPLNVPEIGADYYTGNLHKWVCGPRGSAFLWVSPQRQQSVHPTVISHHLNEGFSKEFGWTGTRDLSAWLSVPSAIAFLNELGWQQVMDHNHRLATWAQQMLCNRWGVEPVSPIDGSLIGSMATLRLPGSLRASRDLPALQQRLYDEFKLEQPLIAWAPAMLRVSCHVYNKPEEYERLAGAILKLANC